jgi:NADH:ubiquinone oxidoreductase subunit 5 (subunit L)/multisubunit Na+/H+ antiporter MnhA subunit
VSYGLQVDSIVSGMLILVTGVSTLVHLYSTSYMDGDPHLRRFMSYLSLFTFFMLILITSSNLVQLFIGWEGVGLCSYLLINFWFTRIQANKAGIKAMVINKVGDIGVLLALSLIWGICGTLDYHSLTSLFSLGLIEEDLMN